MKQIFVEPHFHSRVKEIMSSVSTVGGEIIFQAGVQDVLILISAGLSFIKSLFSVGTYSCWHVIMALMELACSAIALTLFVMYDYMPNNGSTSAYADSRHIFLLAFSYTCALEIQDVILTFQTVRVYRKMKNAVNRTDDADFKQTKKSARAFYIVVLFQGLLMMAILPIIAFYKADWETDYFAPSGFSQKNGQYLLISMILLVAAQVFLLLATIFENDIGWEAKIDPGNGLMSLACTNKSISR